jgi:hypothetical protein
MQSMLSNEAVLHALFARSSFLAWCMQSKAPVFSSIVNLYIGVYLPDQLLTIGFSLLLVRLCHEAQGMCMRSSLTLQPPNLKQCLKYLKTSLSAQNTLLHILCRGVCLLCDLLSHSQLR